MNTIKKQLPKLLVILGGILFAAVPTLATSTLITQQGGTGTTTPSGILYGDNGATSHVNTVSIGTGLSFSGGTLSNTGATFAYPFPSNATSTLINFSGGIQVGTLSGLGGWNNGTPYGISTSSPVSMDITGNAGTVTNGVYTTTFGNLFDVRLTATTTLPQLTTLAGMTTLGNISGLYAGNVGKLYQVSTTSMNASITGLAGTATALAADPTDCGADTWANAIAASGNLTCSAISSAGGGTGQNSSSWTGFPVINGGVWSQQATSTTAMLSLGAITMTNASSTQFSAASQTFYIDSTGHITAKDTVNNWSGAIVPTRNPSFSYATTTAWTATSSPNAMCSVAPYAGTIRDVRASTDAGTLWLDIYIASTHLTLVSASTTVGTFSFSANNTFTAGQTICSVAGTPVSSPTRVSATLDVTITP